MGLFRVLLEQSRLPSGRLGRAMLRIMGGAHQHLMIWGIAQLPSCENVLEVSCGGGNVLAALAESGRFAHVCGIDFSQDAIALAVKRNEKHIKNGLVTVQHASVSALPFDDGSFDAVITVQSHYHWSDITQAMREIYRALKPGGVFVLVAEVYKITHYMKEYNSAAMTETLFTASGFMNVTMQERQKCICVTGVKQP